MMTHRPKSRFTNPVRSLWRGHRASDDPSPRARRLLRQKAPGCETLECRVVLSVSGGGSLLGSLSYAGVVSSPIIVPAQPATPATPWGSAKQNAAVSQLQTDVQKLLTELQTLAGKSGVTIADLESLTTDSQSIAEAGFHFNAQTLNPVISELAVAVAGGNSTAQAQSDFTALFSGSSVSTTVINSTFNDVVKAIGGSAVTTTDLSVAERGGHPDRPR